LVNTAALVWKAFFIVHLIRRHEYCKVLESRQGSDPGSNLGKLPVSGLSGEFGSTCVVEGPNTWEATGGHGTGDVRVGWRAITEGLVAWGD